MGMNLAAVGSFAQGATEGYDRARKRAIEDERQSWERADQEDKQRMRDARKSYEEEMAAARKEVAEGRWAGAELTDKGKQFVAQQQQPAEQAAPQDAATSATSATRTAIAPPSEGQPPAAQPAPKPKLPYDFRQNGEGLYANQKAVNDGYWDRVRDITTRYYEKTGQIDKIPEIDDKVRKWKDGRYTELRSATAAAIATGDPGAMQMASHLTELMGTGAKFDGSNAKFDPKTQMWNGVRTVGPDGKEHIENLSSVQLMTAIGHFSPENLVKFNVDENDKNRKFAIEEKNADSQRISANASATRAGAEKTYYEARAQETKDGIKGANAKAMAETLNKQFPLAGSEIDPTKTVGWSKEKIASRQAQIETETNGLALASQWAGLNPKLDPRVVGAAAKASFTGGGVKQYKDADGRRYIGYGGQKIFIE